MATGRREELKLFFAVLTCQVTDKEKAGLVHGWTSLYIGVSQQWLASTLQPLSEEAIEISGEGKIFPIDRTSYSTLGHPC